MQEIKLWLLDQEDDGKLKATEVETTSDAGAEEKLEDLLVRSPDLLIKRLILIGRQTPTKGGPLDLLGLDEDGRLVVFELKKGKLTRDAVTQAIDYASDLNEMNKESLCKHLSYCSGQHGIQKIDDFEDWYEEKYPNSGDALNGKPRIVLVGLGVDPNALRMVNFLANSGVDIQLLTFHAFERDGILFLARQVESTPPKEPPLPPVRFTKKANFEILSANAKQLGVTELLDKVSEYFRKRLKAYEWPGQTSYSFSFIEKSESGKPTYRVYVSIYLNHHKKGTLNVIFARRSTEAARQELDQLQASFKGTVQFNDHSQQFEIRVDNKNWDSLASALETPTQAILKAWELKRDESDRDDISEELES